MFGYATDETPDLMPATLYYSTRSSSAWLPTATRAPRRFSNRMQEPGDIAYEGSLPVAATAWSSPPSTRRL